MIDLFDDASTQRRQQLAPLADRMRPRSLDEVVGQERLLGPSGVIRRQLTKRQVPNLLLVGDPGCGKTTIARLIARDADFFLAELSAVAAGLADVRRVVAEARTRLGSHGKQSVLFLDEIHRFNRSQQDALLPAVEDGSIRLIGATTENPYVSINRALLSRLVIYELARLSDEDLVVVLQRAVDNAECGLARGGHVTLTDGAIKQIISYSGGDARTALTLLESASFLASERVITAEAVDQASDRKRITFDRAGDQHYDHASAYIKSMRHGHVDDALRWLAQMIAGGEDPLFIARRLVIFAAEDVGAAEPMALLLASAALTSVQAVGLPECRIALAQATRFCTEAPKSRQAIDDIDSAIQSVHSSGTKTVPHELTNRPPPGTLYS